MKNSTTKTAFAVAIAFAILSSGSAFAQMAPSHQSVQHVEKDSKVKYEPWVVSYDEAVKKSEATGRPIMLVFSGSDWCGWCIKLSREVFSTHEFAEWSAERVIKVEVDFPRTYQLPENVRIQNENLKAKYKDLIKVYPTVLFVDAKGNLIAQTKYDGKGAQQFVNKSCMLIPPQQHQRDLVASNAPKTVTAKSASKPTKLISSTEVIKP